MARVAERFCPATQKKKTFPPRRARNVAAGLVQGNVFSGKPGFLHHRVFLQICPSTDPKNLGDHKVPHKLPEILVSNSRFFGPKKRKWDWRNDQNWEMGTV